VFDIKQITKDRLYRVSKKLYAQKETLEQHLSVRTNELFDIQDKIILYDLTNTYFEGRKQGRKLAKYGRSGICFLRTSLQAQSEENVWQFYNTIHEIEASLRVLKTDLVLPLPFTNTMKILNHTCSCGFWETSTNKTIQQEQKRGVGFHQHQNHHSCQNTCKRCRY
jgi:hypothetical protein